MYFDLTKHNVGNTDRLIRALLGALLLIGALLGTSWIAGLIGAVLLGTAYLRFCPVYRLLGFRSDKEATPVSK